MKDNQWTWIKGKWRPIVSFRIITRGKHKGCREVLLYNGKKVIVKG